MKALPSVTGSVAILDRPDVDTDQIIPKQFLKRIERSGYGQYLFFDWMKDPAFELHAYPGASILLAGRNFGCGSSREHAVWAVQQAGFRLDILREARPRAELFASPAEWYRRSRIPLFLLLAATC